MNHIHLLAVICLSVPAKYRKYRKTFFGHTWFILIKHDYSSLNVISPQLPMTNSLKSNWRHGWVAVNIYLCVYIYMYIYSIEVLWIFQHVQWSHCDLLNFTYELYVACECTWVWLLFIYHVKYTLIPVSTSRLCHILQNKTLNFFCFFVFSFHLITSHDDWRWRYSWKSYPSHNPIGQTLVNMQD